jgi:fructosamine-3-kinase
MSYSAHRSWGVFYAEERLAPMLQRAGRILTAQIAADVRSVIERCRAGDFDDADHPARLHGDLWGGNLLWTSDAVVLIDPAAHGGHRETDLAMLELFGCPHLDAVMAGYQSVQPLRPGRRDRVALHQLFPLLAHVVLFGSGYTSATGRAARAALEIS